MTTDVPARIEDFPQSRAQRRVLRVLVSAQVLSGAGLAAGVTVGALLAQDMLGSTSLAGLLSALSITGSALAAFAVGRISQARGRRPGLASGYLAGAIGSAGVIAAAVAGSPVLLFAAMFVYGAGTSTNLLARYAGADLAAPEYRARAVSRVLVATTLGGVAGPSLAAPTGDLAHVLGIPHLAGLFMLSGAAYATAALVLLIWLRPDPLLLARTLEAERAATALAGPDDAERGEGPTVEWRRSDVLVGTFVMAVTQLVMVAIMTMTPVNMHDHGHGDAASGLVIAIHIGAMYLPAPLSGRLVDLYGRLRVATAAALVLLAAGIGAASAPSDSAVAYTGALTLLGVGWSLGLVSGTAIITDAIPPATRARAQGWIDVVIAIAGATGGMASGLVVTAAGYPVLAVSGGLLALAIIPAVIIAARSREASNSGTATSRSVGAR
ncbi:MFS transporter [Actinomadura roseirufa]|uniref:MFS transporter n=1 Tax=Actinomadura roseirufa TaxID=2094049 RepID=UPI001F5F1DA0|nr:MFS transporter [Actinomadura roseirufa]